MGFIRNLTHAGPGPLPHIARALHVVAHNLYIRDKSGEFVPLDEAFMNISLEYNKEEQ